MKHRLLAVLSILIIVSMMPGSALAAPKPIDYKPIDMGPIIRELDASPERIQNTLAEAAAEAVLTATPYTQCVVDTKYWLRYNSTTGGYSLATYYLVAQGPLAQIWVQTNLAWPAGDPRPTPVITCEQAQYMLGQFESNIYPKETTFFGMPDAHDGAVAFLPWLAGTAKQITTMMMLDARWSLSPISAMITTMTQPIQTISPVFTRPLLRSTLIAIS